MLPFAVVISFEGAVKAVAIRNDPKINKDRIVGHSFVAPGRKSDPGIYFDWEYFKSEV
mgnify:CR=1 FL=1